MRRPWNAGTHNHRSQLEQKALATAPKRKIAAPRWALCAHAGVPAPCAQLRTRPGRHRDYAFARPVGSQWRFQDAPSLLF